jgi:hypothetical protein
MKSFEHKKSDKRMNLGTLGRKEEQWKEQKDD